MTPLDHQPWCRNRVALAPMAGITDLPFRELAWEFGAGMVTSEMVSVRPDFEGSRMSEERRARSARIAPHVVQIAGGDPDMMARAARLNVAAGADVIDINMGCPAKKVCNQAAGSALLRDVPLVERILTATVAAVDVPVTLKIRIGWDRAHINAPEVARIAEALGVQQLVVHGRSRACRFTGSVDLPSVAAVVAAVSIPVFVNGDIMDLAGARRALAATGAAGVMIGRAALGQPWLLGDIAAGLDGRPVPDRTVVEGLATMRRHVSMMHDFYGADRAVKLVRKQVGWYLDALDLRDPWRARFNAVTEPDAQLALLARMVVEPDLERAGVTAAVAA